MRILIKNQSDMDGQYDGDSLILQSTIAETEIVQGLTAIKTASKELWAGGTMTYTIVINNDTDTDYETPLFTDLLDSNITIVSDSVKVGGIVYAYTYDAQLLSVNLPTIPANDEVTITFDVMMV